MRKTLANNGQVLKHVIIRSREGCGDLLRTNSSGLSHLNKAANFPPNKSGHMVSQYEDCKSELPEKAGLACCHFPKGKKMTF